MARLVGTSAGIQFYCQYDPDLVKALKAQIPYQDRQPVFIGSKFDHWIVATKHKQLLIDLSIKWLGIDPHLQGSFSSTPVKEVQLLRIEYIGQLKDRGDGNLSALGAISAKLLVHIDYARLGNTTINNSTSAEWDTLDWSVLFPESVLREFFEGNNAKQSVVMTTYYSTLALKQGASQEEIKAAWRKMARRYHPDINRDPDAPETMVAINKAYEILRNPNTRKRYDAGLALQQSVDDKGYVSIGGGFVKFTNSYWRPPLRCGLIMCEGYQSAGKFIVEKILEWKDIVENGKTLVTSWPAGSDSLVRSWI